MEKNIIEINGVIDEWGYMTSQVRYDLKRLEGQPVVCRVSSYGGSVSEALKIAQAFADHGNVTCHLLAFNASAATFLVYGAKTVEMADDGFWLCHRSSVTVDIWRDMNCNDIKTVIQQFRKLQKEHQAIDLMIAQKYIDHAQANGVSITVEQMLDLMNQSRWMPASEALQLGFVDAVIKSAKSLSEQQYDFVKTNAAALHLPSPIEVADIRSDRENNGERKPAVIQWMQRFLGIDDEDRDESQNHSAEEHPRRNSEIPVNNIKPTIIMNEKLTNISALLNNEAISADEQGNVTLNNEQILAIEQRIASARQAEEELDMAQQQLDTVSESIKAISGVKNKILALTAILKQTPMLAPAAASAVPVENEEQKKDEQIRKDAVDPVNAEARAFRL